MAGLLQDTTFWTTISFVLFVGFVFVYGRAKILEAVDGRIKTITQDLENAKKVRLDAEKIYKKAEKDLKAAEMRAEEIVEKAKADAKAMKKETTEKVKAQLARREKQFEDRVREEEIRLNNEFKDKIVSIALEIAEEVISRNLKADDAKKINDTAIASLSKSVLH